VKDEFSEWNLRNGTKKKNKNGKRNR